MKTFSALTMLTLAILLASCSTNSLIIREKNLIKSGHPDTAMRVLSVFNTDDSLRLRMRSRKIHNPSSATSKHLQLRMLATVNHPHSKGVGIAAPQLGVLRQLILVQRFDKPGQPFEAYFNPSIIDFSSETEERDEGCLSIPGYRGPVERPYFILITYRNVQGKKVTEKVSGYTARIFQHEIDHLNGVLYTDHLKYDSLMRKVK